MTTDKGIHIYRAKHPKRVRVICPHHHHLCYGEKQEFYDGTRIFFDCGTMVDYGYGYYKPPKLYRKITIFKDETGYTAWVPLAGWEILVRRVSLNRARHIARLRLKRDGLIIEHHLERNL
jgi:hypothetical protein